MEHDNAQSNQSTHILERNALIAMAVGFFVIAGAVLVAPPILTGKGPASNSTTTIMPVIPVSYSQSNTTTTTIIQHNSSMHTGYNASGYDSSLLNGNGYNQSGVNASVTEDTPYPP